MKKVILALLFVFMMIVVPFSVQAQTVAELQAIIASLQAQIAALVGGGGGTVDIPPVTPTPSCYTFTRDLWVGSVGDDVRDLQLFLNREVGSSLPTTPYFGNETKLALIKFQRANGIPLTGYFGPLTRAAVSAKNAGCVVVPPSTTMSFIDPKAGEVVKAGTAYMVNWGGSWSGNDSFNITEFLDSGKDFIVSGLTQEQAGCPGYGKGVCSFSWTPKEASSRAQLAIQRQYNGGGKGGGDIAYSEFFSVAAGNQQNSGGEAYIQGIPTLSISQNYRDGYTSRSALTITARGVLNSRGGDSYVYQQSGSLGFYAKSMSGKNLPTQGTAISFTMNAPVVTDRLGNSYYKLSEGTPYSFTQTVSYDTGLMFGGVYKGMLSHLSYFRDVNDVANNINPVGVEVGPYSSPSAYVVGEKGPYLTSAIEMGKNEVGMLYRVNGERLDGNSVVYVDGSVYAKQPDIALPASRDSLLFGSQPLSPGNHYVYVVNPTTGRSNTVYLQVGNTTNEPSLTVTTPNGGEIYYSNDLQVSWQSNYNSQSVKVHLYSPIDGDKYVSPNLNSTIGGNSFIIPAGTIRAMNSGQYKINVCDDNQSPSGDGLSGKSLCDLSDDYFTLKGSTSNIFPVANPVISSFTGPNVITAGQTGTWTASLASSSGPGYTYSIDWGDGSGFQNITNPAVATSNIRGTHSYARAGSYDVTFRISYYASVTCVRAPCNPVARTVEAKNVVTVAAATTPTNGWCGSANGQSYPTQPDSSLTCSRGTSADMRTTTTGWAWNCLGTNGGIPVSCWATKSVVAPPTSVDLSVSQTISSNPSLENIYEDSQVTFTVEVNNPSQTSLADVTGYWIVNGVTFSINKMTGNTSAITVPANKIFPGRNNVNFKIYPPASMNEQNTWNNTVDTYFNVKTRTVESDVPRTLTINIDNQSTGYVIGGKNNAQGISAIEFNCGQQEEVANAKIWTGTACSQTYPNGTIITLVASHTGLLKPDNKAIVRGTFGGWGNSCNSKSTWTSIYGETFESCLVNLNQDKVINVSFTAPASGSTGLNISSVNQMANLLQSLQTILNGLKR